MNWTETTGFAFLEGKSSATSVVDDGKIYVIGRNDGSNNPTNEIWVSVDGVIWNKEIDDISDLDLRYHSSFVLNSKIWIIGGQKITSSDMTNEVWSIE